MKKKSDFEEQEINTGNNKKIAFIFQIIFSLFNGKRPASHCAFKIERPPPTPTRTPSQL